MNDPVKVTLTVAFALAFLFSANNSFAQPVAKENCARQAARRLMTPSPNRKDGTAAALAALNRDIGAKRINY